MTEKNFDVKYFFAPDDVKRDLKANLEGALKESLTPKDDSILFYVAAVKGHKGVFCLNKYRNDNLPKVAKWPLKDERDLGLQSNEGLVEKAYFAFDKNTGNLALQCNGNVCNSAAFPNRLAKLFRHSQKIIPITENRDLIATDHVVDLDVSFALPQHSLSPEDVKSSALVEGMKKVADALSVTTHPLNFKILAGRDGAKKESLDSNAILDFLHKFKCKKAKVTLMEDPEGVDPSLLLLDLMEGKTMKKNVISVAMNDRYPDENDIAPKLLQCLSD